MLSYAFVFAIFFVPISMTPNSAPVDAMQLSRSSPDATRSAVRR